MGAYIYLGPELGKKQDAVNNVRSQFKNSRQTEPPTQLSAEEFIFYGDETPAAVIVDTLQNQGLFADSRIVIVKNAEAIKKKEEIDQIVSWTKSSINDNSTALILLSDEIKIAAGFDIAKANKQIFYELFESEKNEWVRNFFRREGLSINDDCVYTILEMVENNTDALKRECSRLINFLPKNKQINNEDIEKWLAHNREESAFTLFSRIAAGDLNRALESISVMLAAKISASGIISGLAWCFRKLGDYLALVEAGNANNSVELKQIGLSSQKTKNDYIAAARRYDSDAVEECLALTARYDILLRSPAAVMENILMDRYIITVINTGMR